MGLRDWALDSAVVGILKMELFCTVFGDFLRHFIELTRPKEAEGISLFKMPLLLKIN